MLVKRNELEGVIIESLFSSSNILASSYNKDTRELILTFNKGGRYKYLDVSFNDYTRFEIAESQGSVFYSHINKHSSEKLTSVNPSELINEVEKRVKKEKIEIYNLKLEKMVNGMKEIIGYSESNTKLITKLKLENLKIVIDGYLEVVSK